ncbi:MAG: VWA domain-containing protein [Ignavibacteria bacterium]|nr:VWA domain-containing protein [Ignavibacteria bacterium]
MNRFYWYLVAALVLCIDPRAAMAQFPVTLTLDARSADPVVTPPTRSDARYRITVSGTYSQWPQFADCHGVDAVWVYDVPQEEIDAFRWPPKQILGQPFVEIPHWVGDSTNYSFPPKGFGIEPLFEISFRKYLGFRVNGEPFPALPLDPILHRYQQTRAGTGEPFSFRIVDSTLVLQAGTPVARHEDNCGSLTVVVEEILPKEINICDVQPIEINGETIGLRVDAAVLELDSTIVDGQRNLLTSPEKIGIVSDGKFICPDSLVCDKVRTKPLSIGLVVDVSGSMQDIVSFEGASISRIEALKIALLGTLKKLLPGDSLFLIRFNETVVLTRDWTSDTASLGTAIRSLFASGFTAFHEAMIQGLTKMSTHKAPYKVLIAMTDGLNNRPPYEEAPVINTIRSANVPVYLIALGFTGDTAEASGLASMQRFVQAAPTGKLYRITTGDELVSVYSNIANNVATEDCCRLYFKIPPCDRGQSKRNLRLVYVEGDQIVSKNIVVDCDLKTTGVMADDNADDDRAEMLQADPTPSSDVASITCDLTAPSFVQYELYTIDGVLLRRTDIGMVDLGRTRIDIPVNSLVNGLYVCRVVVGRTAQHVTILVQR